MSSVQSGFPLLISTAPDERFSPKFVRCFAIAIIIIFAVVHSPVDFVQLWYDAAIKKLFLSGFFSAEQYEYSLLKKELIVVAIVSPLRGLLFFLSLLCISYPLVQNIKNYLRHSKNIWTNKVNLKLVLLSFGALCILSIPSNLGQGGDVYAAMTFNPFNFHDPSRWFYQRILMSSIAYIFQLKGILLYFCFSLFCTFSVLWLTYLFFVERNIFLSRLEMISIGTSSFIMVQLQSPGYTEQLSYIFLLLLFVIPTSTYARVSIVVLALLSHEVSAVPMIFIALMYFSALERRMVIGVVALYVLFWLVSFHFNAAELLSVRNVHGRSGFSFILEYPLRELFGIVMAFKLLWIPMVLAFYKMQSYRFMLAGFILIAIFFTLMGVDTTRLMGFGFVSLLFSIFWVKRYSLLSQTAFKYVMATNIIVPSFYVGANVGVVFFNGVYQWFAKGVFFH